MPISSIVLGSGTAVRSIVRFAEPGPVAWTMYCSVSEYGPAPGSIEKVAD